MSDFDAPYLPIPEDPDAEEELARAAEAERARLDRLYGQQEDDQ